MSMEILVIGTIALSYVFVVIIAVGFIIEWVLEEKENNRVKDNQNGSKAS